MGILPRCSVHPGGRGGGTEASGWDGAIEDRDGGLGVGCTWPCRTSAVGGGVADRYWHSELKRRYCRALSFLTRMIPGQVIAPRHGTCILPYSVRRIHKLYMDKVTQEHLYMARILNVSLTHTVSFRCSQRIDIDIKARFAPAQLSCSGRIPSQGVICQTLKLTNTLQMGVCWLCLAQAWESSSVVRLAGSTFSP